MTESEPTVVKLPDPRMSLLLRSALLLTGVALLLGVAVEVLFYGHPFGISFPLWALLSVAALLGVAAALKITPRLEGWLLPIPILFFAVASFLRREPLTGLLCVGLTLSLFAIWVRTFQEGRLLQFGWLDYARALIWVPLEACIRPWNMLGATGRKLFGERGTRSTLAAVLRGLFLALPIFVVFVALLHSADLVFAGMVDNALEWLDLARLADWAGRALLVIVSGIFFLGALVAALRDVEDRKLVGEGKSLLKPFLGFTEALVVLGIVDLLFGVFVVIQFAYLFGGEANITAAGYTYSEYARQGFGELVGVGVLSLLLVFALATVTQREKPRQGNWFNGLSGALVGLVGVILASALMRLLLYENAYGFTRLRTYTHVAIVWMGLLFLAFLILLLTRELRRFSTACAVGLLGFTATLSLLNVDAFIVRQNAARYTESGKIDLEYIFSLSEDAVPGMVRLAQDGPPALQESILPELACLRAQLEERTADLRWPSYHLSRAAAISALDSLDLAQYGLRVNDYGVWSVIVDGVPQQCLAQPWRGGID
jgi:hypothetical protein